MAIDVDIKIHQDLLIIIASGVENNIKDSENYISTMLQAAVDTQCEKILCDERNLQYDLDIEEAMGLADYINSYAPNVGKTAIVCNAIYKDDVNQWVKELQKEGHDLFFFTDYDEAYKWVNE